MSEAETTDGRHIGDIAVWGWLLALLGAGLAVIALPIPKLAILLLVFSIAAVKAALVLRNYMHLRSEHLLIYLIAAVPVLLVIGFVLALIPDIILRR